MSFKKLSIAFLTAISTIIILSSCDSNQQTSSEEDPPADQSTSEEQQPNNNESSNDTQKPLTLPDEELQKGDQGDSVLTLQEILNEVGYSLEETHIFDQQTIWAVTDLQLQQESVDVSGMYNEQTKQVIEKWLTGDLEIDPGSALAYTENKLIDDDTVELGNPYEVLALVNKKHALPADYIPDDLVIPNVRFPFVEDDPKKQMRKEAAQALEDMFAAADLAGVDLFAQSGYRSYERQDSIFASNVSVHGEEEANTFSAKPGESEHQSGLTMDVTSPDVNYQLNTDFGDTEEGKWIQENAADYGFIIRYPKGKEDITEYQYEPWHLRYVGIRAATEIHDQGITLEEYIDGL